MGADTSIAWCDHTFNPWWGCFKISPGCKNCYAAAFDRRLGGDHWRTDRRFFGDDHWRKPEKWNRDAAKAGVRRRVFCASMADVFEDRDDLDEHRARLWKLIAATPHLDWLLLTKRPENFERFLAWSFGHDSRGKHRGWADPYPNVWIGTTTEDQEHADRRVPLLLAVPAVVRFLSVEPMLGPVEIRGERDRCGDCDPRIGGQRCAVASAHASALHPDGINWVIAGCESGHHARPAQVDWYRSLRDQCAAAEVPFLLKQAVAADLVTIGAGSFTKERGNLIELPYLDGTQHAAFPNPTTAAPAAETSDAP